MASLTYAHDGADWRHIAGWYASLNGTNLFLRLRAAYCHDGTAWRKVFAQISIMEIVTISNKIAFVAYDNMETYWLIVINRVDFSIEFSYSSQYPISQLTPMQDGVVSVPWLHFLYNNGDIGSLNVPGYGMFSLPSPLSGGTPRSIFGIGADLICACTKDFESIPLRKWNGSSWSNYSTFTLYGGPISCGMAYGSVFFTFRDFGDADSQLCRMTSAAGYTVVNSQVNGVRRIRDISGGMFLIGNWAVGGFDLAYYSGSGGSVPYIGTASAVTGGPSAGTASFATPSGVKFINISTLVVTDDASPRPVSGLHMAEFGLLSGGLSYSSLLGGSVSPSYYGGLWLRNGGGTWGLISWGHPP